MKIHYPGDRFAHLRSLCKFPSVLSRYTTTDVEAVTCERCRVLLIKQGKLTP